MDTALGKASSQARRDLRTSDSALGLATALHLGALAVVAFAPFWWRLAGLLLALCATAAMSVHHKRLVKGTFRVLATCYAMLMRQAHETDASGSTDAATLDDSIESLLQELGEDD